MPTSPTQPLLEDFAVLPDPSVPPVTPPPDSPSGTHPPSLPPTVRFGDFTFDLHRLELRSDGKLVELQRRHAEALALFVNRPGEVVTRQELIDGLWGDTIVDYEKNLRPIINRLRHALSDSAKHPRYLETVRGEGYRFLEPVGVLESRPGIESGLAPTTSPDETPRRLSLVTLGGLALAVILAVWWISSQPTAATAEASPRLSIQPFETSSTLNQDEAELVSGLALHFGSELTRRGGAQLQVTLPELADEAPGDPAAPPGTQASHYLRGVVTRVSEHFELELFLLRAPAGQVLWTDVRSSTTIAGLTRGDELTTEILAELGVQGSQPHHQGVASDYVLRAIYHLQRGAWEDLAAVQELCDKALLAEPNDADAHGLLAAAEHRRWIMTLDPSHLETARSHASSALGIDPSNYKSLHVLAAISLHYDRDTETAAGYLARARSANPRSVGLMLFSANYHFARGEWAKARELVEAVQEVSPAYGAVQTELDWIRYGSRDFETALAGTDRAIELAPEAPAVWFIRLKLAQNLERHEIAAEAARRLLDLFAIPAEEQAPAVQSVTEGNYVTLWNTFLGRYHRIMNERPMYPEQLAFTYADLRDDELAMQWLEEAWNRGSGWLPSFLMYPVLDPLRPRSDFQDLHRRVLEAHGVDVAGIDLGADPRTWADR